MREIGGLIGLVGWYLIPVTPLILVFLIYGWNKNFRLVVKSPWLQANWRYFPLFLVFLGLLIVASAAFGRARYSISLSWYSVLLDLAMNPLWFPISLLVFGSVVLLPLKTTWRWSLFNALNWTALILLSVIPVWYLMTEEALRTIRESSTTNPFIGPFLSVAFFVVSLAASKWPEHKRALITGTTIVGVILLSSVVWDRTCDLLARVVTNTH